MSAHKFFRLSDKQASGKTAKVIYWIATGWLSLGMVSTGIVQLIKMPEEVLRFNELGLPVYLLTLLGVWKLLGVIAILLPQLPVLKEWAYAGFFFVMTGAIYAHLSARHPVSDLFPALLLLALTSISWYFIPARQAKRPKNVYN